MQELRQYPHSSPASPRMSVTDLIVHDGTDHDAQSYWRNSNHLQRSSTVPHKRASGQGTHDRLARACGWGLGLELDGGETPPVTPASEFKQGPLDRPRVFQPQTRDAVRAWRRLQHLMRTQTWMGTEEGGEVEVDVAQELPLERILAGWVAEHDRENVSGPKVFGAHVDVAVRAAPASAALCGGWEFEVPLVVYSSVDELNRTGIYEPGLFRTMPNRPHLARLIEAFEHRTPHLPPISDGSLSTPPSPTSPFSISHALGPPMRKETTANVAALLKTYIDLLPEPLVDNELADALVKWCVEPSRKAREVREHCRTHSEPCTFPMSSPSSAIPIPLTPSEMRALERNADDALIAVAQCLLRLMPPRKCALLAYLMSFFTQLPLSPDNGMGFADVAKMFGKRLVGAHPETESTVIWLLERWSEIAESFCITQEVDMHEIHQDLLAIAHEGQMTRAPAYRFGEMNDLRSHSMSVSSDGSVTSASGESEELPTSPFVLSFPRSSCAFDIGRKPRSGDVFGPDQELWAKSEEMDMGSLSSTGTVNAIYYDESAKITHPASY